MILAIYFIYIYNLDAFCMPVLCSIIKDAVVYANMKVDTPDPARTSVTTANSSCLVKLI